MKVVPQSIFPIDLNVLKNYISIGAEAGTGSNVPFFKEDGLTLKGGNITLKYNHSNTLMNSIAKEELTSMLMGSVESTNGYPSIYDTSVGSVLPQDKRRQQFIIYRFNSSGGRQFPDLPPNF